jgi:hypothetical protein
MRITEKDIGKKVKRKDGKILTIYTYDENAIPYRVTTVGEPGEYCWYTDDGSYDQYDECNPFDLVELLDDPTKSFEEDIEEWSNSCVGEEELDDELDERFVTKVPSIESNAIRLLKQLKAQGIMQLTIVADLGDGKEGEIKVEVYGKN